MRPYLDKSRLSNPSKLNTEEQAITQGHPWQKQGDVGGARQDLFDGVLGIPAYLADAEARQLTRNVTYPAKVVFQRNEDWEVRRCEAQHVLDSRPGDQRPGLEKMFERKGFDEFLNARGNLSGVTLEKKVSTHH